MNDLTLPKAPNYIHRLYLCFYTKMSRYVYKKSLKERVFVGEWC